MSKLSTSLNFTAWPFASLSVSDGPKDELERSTIPGSHCGEEKTKHLPLSPNHIHKNIVIKNQSRPWFQTFCYVHPDPWGNDPIWRSHIFQQITGASCWSTILSMTEPPYELWDSSRFGPPSPQRPEWFAPGRKLSRAEQFDPPPPLVAEAALKRYVGGSSPLWNIREVGRMSDKQWKLKTM